MSESQDPYETPRSEVAERSPDQQLPIFKCWLVFFLIATVGGGILGGIIGAITGIVMGSAGNNMLSIQLVSGAIGFLIGLPISYFTFKWSVSTYIIGHPSIAQAIGRKR